MDHQTYLIGGLAGEAKQRVVREAPAGAALSRTAAQHLDLHDLHELVAARPKPFREFVCQGLYAWAQSSVTKRGGWQVASYVVAVACTECGYGCIGGGGGGRRWWLRRWRAAAAAAAAAAAVAAPFFSRGASGGSREVVVSLTTRMTTAQALKSSEMGSK